MIGQELFFSGFANKFSTEFDGVEDYVTAGGVSDFNYYHGATNPSAFQFTISVWVKFINPNQNNVQTILQNQNVTTANIGISINLDSRSSSSASRRIILQITNGGGTAPINGVSANNVYPNSSGWVHLIWTHNQSSASGNSNLYINNSLVATFNKSIGTPSTSNAFQVMSFGRPSTVITGSTSLNGKIYHPIFINKVLNASERLELFTNPHKKATDFSFGANVTNAYRFPNGQDSFDVLQDYVSGINGAMTNQTASNISPDIPDLQTLPAYGIWSLRRINPNSISCIQVTRSSDNTFTNIGYDVNGNLDEAQLLAFVGSGNGTLRQWYDQSGNGNHFQQTTVALQPQIVVSGVIQKDNGKPTVISNGTRWMQVPSSTALYNFLHQGQGIIAQVLNYTDGDTRIPISNANTSSDRGFIVSFSDVSPNLNAAALQINRGVLGTFVCFFNAINSVTPGQQTLQISVINCIASAIDRGKIFVDNSSEYTGNVSNDSISTLNASNNLMLFRRPGSTTNWMVGGIQETIIYANNVKNIEDIKQDINNYYNIY